MIMIIIITITYSTNNNKKRIFFTMNKLINAVIMSLLSLSYLYAEDINIYTSREKFLIKPLLQEFTKETGIKTNVIFASKGLAQRIQSEGQASPADVILTNDVSSMHEFDYLQLLQPIESDYISQHVPAHLWGETRHWVALTKRMRVIIASKERVPENSISTYEELADDKWQNKICTRKGSHVYNRSLLASLIDEHGYEKAKKWAQGLVNNLARKPQGNDRAQAKAIYNGECDLAIINQYYFGKMLTSPEDEQRKWADSIYIIYPNQQDRGTHVNISSGAIAKYSKNKDNAVKLLEFLLSEKAQSTYASLNFEYPANSAVTYQHDYETQTDIKQDERPIHHLITHSFQAQMLINEILW